MGGTRWPIGLYLHFWNLQEHEQFSSAHRKGIAVTQGLIQEGYNFFPLWRITVQLLTCKHRFQMVIVKDWHLWSLHNSTVQSLHNSTVLLNWVSWKKTNQAQGQHKWDCTHKITKNYFIYNLKYWKAKLTSRRIKKTFLQNMPNNFFFSHHKKWGGNILYSCFKEALNFWLLFKCFSFFFDTIKHT